MAKPVKFKDRGVFLGFETTGLGNMRCRASKNPDEPGFEALINNWAGDSSVGGGTGDMIIPFHAVPDWAALTDRDMALHASVTQYGYKTEGYIDPQGMREIRFETDMAFADSMLRMRAVEELRIESMDSQNTYFEILSIFARKYGASTDNHELTYVSRPILQQLSRENPEDVLRLTREITKVAAQYGEITAEVLSARLDFYSAFAAPICSLLDNNNYDREVGYLSRQLGGLEILMDELEDFREEANHEINDFISAIQDNADKFINYTETQANNIQILIIDDRSYTRDEKFKELKEELFDNRMHIAFALDGWEQHFVAWKKIRHEETQVKEDFIAKLYHLMPQPTKELEDAIRDYDFRGAGSRRGTIRMMHNWDDDGQDIELINRVEAGRFNKSALQIVNSENRSKKRVGKTKSQSDQ